MAPAWSHTIPMSGTSAQPTPTSNSTTGEVDAGNWLPTTSWSVPSSAVSGVYIAHLVDQNDTTNENHIPFIVRADESTSDILFQTSDTTWHAYNGWPCAPVNGTVQVPNQTSTAAAALAAIPLLAVLIRSAITGRSPLAMVAAPLPAHRTFFLAPNTPQSIGWNRTAMTSPISPVSILRALPPCWVSIRSSRRLATTNIGTPPRAPMWRQRVPAALNLLFMSGNEVYWKTRWEASIDGSATPFRTLVCYKETRHNAPLDPLDPPTWTGTWRDPRFSPPADGGKPENALTGTITIEAGAFDVGRAIQVPLAMSRLRFWRSTPHVANATSGRPRR